MEIKKLFNLIDIDNELISIEKDIQHFNRSFGQAYNKVSNENFSLRAPREIVEKELLKKDEFGRQLVNAIEKKIKLINLKLSVFRMYNDYLKK